MLPLWAGSLVVRLAAAPPTITPGPGALAPAGDEPAPGGPAPTGPLSAAHPDALPAEPGTPHTLFINFDGAVLRRGCGNDSRHNCSTLADTFRGYVGPFIGTEARRLAIVESVRDDLEGIGVRTTWTRPPPDTDYTMVLYGDIGPQDFAGLAPYIDCGNLWPRDTAFAGAYQGIMTGATIVLQEAAHTWGLEHVAERFDNLHPVVDAPAPSFLDGCYKIVANTDLDETGGVCNLVHEMFCDTGYQNSYRELLYLFGPAQPDITAPEIEVTSPAQGSVHVAPVDLDLRGVITDDLDPQLFAIEIRLGDALVFSGQDIRLGLHLKKPPPGDYDLEISARDPAGNRGVGHARFTILPPGSVDPDGEDPDEDPEPLPAGLPSQDEGCRLVRPAPAPLLLTLLLGLPRRRRRFGPPLARPPGSR